MVHRPHTRQNPKQHISLVSLLCHKIVVVQCFVWHLGLQLWSGVSEWYMNTTPDYNNSNLDQSNYFLVNFHVKRFQSHHKDDIELQCTVFNSYWNRCHMHKSLIWPINLLVFKFQSMISNFCLVLSHINYLYHHSWSFPRNDMMVNIILCSIINIIILRGS